MNDLIQAIKKSCEVYFNETTFSIKSVNSNNYIISGGDMTTALDNYRNGKREIKALKWFNDFWCYMELNVVLSKEYPTIFFTLSIFQGPADDNIKTQLFRAEWDNYKDNTKHPQPHWHIYPFKYDSKTYDDFEVFNEMKTEEENADGFEAKILQTNNRIIDIRNIHFAMNAQWAENKGCIHTISDNTIFTNWLSGILTHIKEQLEYACE